MLREESATDEANGYVADNEPASATVTAGQDNWRSALYPSREKAKSLVVLQDDRLLAALAVASAAVLVYIFVVTIGQNGEYTVHRVASCVGQCRHAAD